MGVLAALAFLASSVSAQPDLTKPGDYSIKTADGYLMIRNGINRSLSFQVVGKNIEPQTAAGNPSFLIDGRLVQILKVPRENFEPTGKEAVADLLGLHQKWESDYLADEIFGEKLAIESKTEKVGDRDVMFWSFKRPKYTTEFERDYFATTLFGDDIFGLSSPIKIGSDLAEYRTIFDGIFKSLKIQDKPFDVEKIASEIRNSISAE